MRVRGTVALVALVLGCLVIPNASAAGLGTLQGTVVDEPTGLPFLGTAGVAICTEDTSPSLCPEELRTLAFANADGAYSLQLAPGEYWVRGFSLECHGPASPLVTEQRHVVVSDGVTGVEDFGITDASPISLVPAPYSAAPSAPVDLVEIQTTYVDTSRPTLRPCVVPVDHRTLPVVIDYPSSGAGPFPLVVTGHGLGQAVTGGSPLLESRDLARRGYVVATVTYPLTFAAVAPSPYPRDLFNQAPDLSFVITSVLNSTAAGLQGVADPNHIGIFGTSGSGITALMFYNECCIDPRVDAIAPTLGFPLNAVEPFDWQGGPPLFMANNEDDPLIPYALARGAWEQAAAPKYLVTERDAPAHGISTAGLYELRLAFLDAYLRGTPGSHQALSLYTAPAGSTYEREEPAALAPVLIGPKGTSPLPITAGRAVPVKFTLGGNQSLDIFTSPPVMGARPTCTVGAPAVTTPATGSLDFDRASATYSFVWKTTKSMHGCYQLTLPLVSGDLNVLVKGKG